MFDLGRRAYWVASAAFVGVIAAVIVAMWIFVPTPPSTITMLAGIRNSTLDQYARDYQQTLARHGVRLNLRYIGGPNDNVNLLEEPASGVDVAFVLGGVSEVKQPSSVLSLGRVTSNPIWIFYRGAQPVESLSQFEDKRIAGNHNLRLVRELLGLAGLTAETATLLQRTGPAAIKAIKEGEADVVLLIDPLESGLVQTLLKDPDIRLMNVSQAEALTRRLPYLDRLTFPRGVVDLKQNIPPADVSLVATGTSVVVRENLHPQVIYLLAQALQARHGGPGIFQKAGTFPTQTDAEFGFAEEARDFYRNGAPFLQRYVPYWQISFVKKAIAIALAVIAIIVPLFTYPPKLYRSVLQLHLKRLYRRLRAVESELAQDLSQAELRALDARLQDILAESASLPKRHSDLFFDLNMHVDRVRTHVAARLAAKAGEPSSVASAGDRDEGARKVPGALGR